VAPYFIYSKLLRSFHQSLNLRWLPLYEYSIWIAEREFAFYRHVAFDQLVTPQTTYISRDEIIDWLSSYKNVDRESVYLIMRNGNSWKFGARVS
jgi:hypothetical protein